MSRERRQRLATWVLIRCTPEYMRESFIGDLVEQYEARGDWWYWRQALGAIRARAQGVFLNAVHTEVLAAEFVGDLVLSIALGIVGCSQLCVCASICFSWTPLIRSALGLLIGSALMGGALICAVSAARVIRMSIRRQLHGT